MSLSLYEISGEMQALEDLLLESDGEVTPEIEAWEKEFSLLERNKVDSYGAFMKNLAAEAAACKEEGDRLIARAKARTKALDRLKRNAMMHMENRGVKQLQGDKFTLAKQKNSSPSVIWLDGEGNPTEKPNLEALPAELVKFVPEPDNAAAKLAIAGEIKVLPPDVAATFVKVEVGYHVRVR